MRPRITLHRVLVTACCLALLVFGSLGRGEVARSGEPEPGPDPERLAPTLAPDLALHAQCRQHGIKVDQGQPAVVVLALGDGLCLPQPRS